MNVPTVLRPFARGWLVRCPGCQLEARADDDQVHGRISIDCPACPYHETHDLSDQVREHSARNGDTDS